MVAISEGAQIPRWKQEISMAFKFLEVSVNSCANEVNTVESSFQIQKKLLAFSDVVAHELPDAIMYREQYFTFEKHKESTQPVTSELAKFWFLPKTHEHYTVVVSNQQTIPPELDPDMPEFVGFETLRNSQQLVKGVSLTKLDGENAPIMNSTEAHSLLNSIKKRLGDKLVQNTPYFDAYNDAYDELYHCELSQDGIARLHARTIKRRLRNLLQNILQSPYGWKIPEYIPNISTDDNDIPIHYFTGDAYLATAPQLVQKVFGFTIKYLDYEHVRQIPDSRWFRLAHPTAERLLSYLPEDWDK